MKRAWQGVYRRAKREAPVGAVEAEVRRMDAQCLSLLSANLTLPPTDAHRKQSWQSSVDFYVDFWKPRLTLSILKTWAHPQKAFLQIIREELHTDEAPWCHAPPRTPAPYRLGAQCLWSLISARFKIIPHESSALSNSTSDCTGSSRGSLMRSQSSCVEIKRAGKEQGRQCRVRGPAASGCVSEDSSKYKTLGKAGVNCGAEWLCGLVKNHSTDGGNVSRKKKVRLCMCSAELQILSKLHGANFVLGVIGSWKGQQPP